MWLISIHHGLFNTCLIFSSLIGVYGLWRFWRHSGVGGNLWGMLVIAEGLYVVQDIVGAAMLLQGLSPARAWIHFLYGVVMLITLPGAYAFTQGRDGRREALMYAVIGLFLAGVALRAMSTGQLP